MAGDRREQRLLLVRVERERADVHRRVALDLVGRERARGGHAIKCPSPLDALKDTHDNSCY
jgi:hypothetical protein